MASVAGIPLVDSMMAQKVLMKNMFSFFMSSNPKEPSELIFGDIDKSKFTGSIIWHKVIKK